MKQIKVKTENGKLVCDPTSTRTKAADEEKIVWIADGVGNDVVVFFEKKSPFTDGGRGPFPISKSHTISRAAEPGKYKFEHIEGDIIVD